MYSSQKLGEVFAKFCGLLIIQQGLEIRGFWFQKKTVQLKTALRVVYTYVLDGFFFKKQCICKAFGQNPRTSRLLFICEP